MNKRISTSLLHILGCLIFLALPYLFAEDGFARLADLPYDAHERRNVLSYLLTIVFFYTNYFILIPRFFFRKQYGLYGLTALGCFLLIESMLVIVNRQGTSPTPTGYYTPYRDNPPPRPMEAPSPFPSMRPPLPPPGSRPSQQTPRRPGPSELNQTFFLTMAGFLMAIVIRVNTRWQETEREKIQTELSYLKAQINPHFLFNTLNSIYSLAIVESPQTADAIVKLSSFLRYVIQESQKEQVSLQNELAYIDQYIALQKLRLGDTVHIDYTVEGRANGKQIVPLLLISFIENAFKYGVSPEEHSTITVAITIQDSELTCHVFNKKVRVFQPTAVASGIGLSNTKARLQLLYPDRHQLVIHDTSTTFTVDLSLTLA
ncbi:MULTISPECIES: sensor histidine kinase [unclassified Spirosoma]|uniref:sensor histidine kinase n=1 Tax=unclassified Spirosoma TaxID=2621999 RepID=UPI00095D2704|nr:MULTISPECIES: sensor histidine kinase [unclassified Spirosoma]MBN8820610.1 sensor histidine kinase [Spirosoma sp.]OJW71734.1 MAG: sensor histidine kinase [Spirosoma sp. 48-14]